MTVTVQGDDNYAQRHLTSKTEQGQRKVYTFESCLHLRKKLSH